MVLFASRHVPRLNVLDKDLLEKSHVPILTYRDKKYLLKNIKFTPLKNIHSKTSFVDLLWKNSYYFNHPIPFWSGSMQMIHEKQTKEKYNKDNITFLPIIDLNPTDMNCILSTSTYLSNLAYKHNQSTIVTFDQPLYFGKVAKLC